MPTFTDKTIKKQINKKTHNFSLELSYEKSYKLTWFELVHNFCWPQEVLGTMQSAAQRKPQPGMREMQCLDGVGRQFRQLETNQYYQITLPSVKLW